MRYWTKLKLSQALWFFDKSVHLRLRNFMLAFVWLSQGVQIISRQKELFIVAYQSMSHTTQSTSQCFGLLSRIFVQQNTEGCNIYTADRHRFDRELVYALPNNYNRRSKSYFNAEFDHFNSHLSRVDQIEYGIFKICWIDWVVLKNKIGELLEEIHFFCLLQSKRNHWQRFFMPFYSSWNSIKRTDN